MNPLVSHSDSEDKHPNRSISEYDSDGNLSECDSESRSNESTFECDSEDERRSQQSDDKKPKKGEKRRSVCNDDVFKSDQRVFKRLHKQLAGDAEISCDVAKQQKETCQRYYTSYMEKVMNKLPMGRNILEALQIPENGGGPEAFLTMYSAAKMVVHTEMQFKKIKAFNSVFDLINAIVGKYVHNKFVKPMAMQYAPSDRLDEAFEAYQNALVADDASTTLELQCVLYLVQSEMESKTPLKVPHPMMNRFSQQMKAMSHYVLKILTAFSVSSNSLDWIIHQGGKGEKEEEETLVEKKENVDGKDETCFVKNGERYVMVEEIN